MSLVTLAEGSIFAGRYKVVRNIAAGGMGAVYEVLHLETARRRALKAMHPHLVQSDDLRRRFLAEARVAGQVESAYIVDVFDAGVDETTKMPFLVMELLKGEELGRRLKRVGRFGLEEAVGYLWQTALALDKTHKANIVHRDLKPENLFLCEDDDGPSRIKVLDFGIAKLVAEGGTQANLTRAVGTPLYMAPEQFRSKSTVSPATDIYALGMMAYTMLVGASYWAEEQASEENPYAFAMQVMEGPEEPPRTRALRKGIRLPEAFDKWFGQATSRKPEQRFVKATLAVKGLAEALGVPLPARLTGRSGSTTDPSGAVAEAADEALADVGRTGPGPKDSRISNAGQTGPGRTRSGQTGPGQTVPSPASSSGPQGTVVLEEASVADPATSLFDLGPLPNDVGTSIGVSASQPLAETGPRDPTLTTGLRARRRKRTLTLVSATVGLVCVAAIGVVGFNVRKLQPPLSNARDVSGIPSTEVPVGRIETAASAITPIPGNVPVLEPSVHAKPIESAAPAEDLVFEEQGPADTTGDAGSAPDASAGRGQSIAAKPTAAPAASGGRGMSKSIQKRPKDSILGGQD